MLRSVSRPNSFMTLVAVASLTFTATAAPPSEHVTISYEGSVNFGESVWALGDIDILGDNFIPFALRLAPESNGTRWSATVNVPLGTDFTYQLLRRSDAVNQWPSPANQTALGVPVSDSTSPAPANNLGRGILLHSFFINATLNWRYSDEPTLQTVTGTQIGPGRVPGESLYEFKFPADPGREIEFFITSTTGGRDPLNGEFVSALDAMFVQDRQVFGYLPQPSVSSPRFDPQAAFVSAFLPAPRPISVLLPRGYDDNPDKRYPVAYFHDGQNLYPPAPFGAWNVGTTSEAMTASGQMRETIIVAIDHSGATRACDYLPAYVGWIGCGPDDNTNYTSFLIQELKPFIDATYRTLPDRDNTLTIGSSFGGIISTHLGIEFPETFGKLGIFSPSFWLSSVVNRVEQGSKLDTRIYLDSGTGGSSFDSADDTMRVRDIFLNQGWVLEDDLRHVIGYGDLHNEAAWSKRLPQAFDFLLPATEEPNTLRQVIFGGDLNCDGVVNTSDIDPFVTAILLASEYAAQFPDCDRMLADLNLDGDVNTSDIDPFVERLLR